MNASREKEQEWRNKLEMRRRKENRGRELLDCAGMVQSERSRGATEEGGRQASECA